LTGLVNVKSRFPPFDLAALRQRRQPSGDHRALRNIEVPPHEIVNR